MSLHMQNIVLNEKDGTIVVSKKGGGEPEMIRRVWFDSNCPYCRKHWLDNLDDYIKEILDEKLILEMTPVAFLTQYSFDIGALLLALEKYGSDLYFDVFDSAIFHGVSESFGNDESITEPKLKELYNEIISPALKKDGISIEEFQAALERSYDQIKQNTENANKLGIDSVPHVEDRKIR